MTSPTPPSLGRYRLDQQVGQGGMAVVWRGYDTQLRRTVAVKILHPHLHMREEVRRRFDREAHAVARLHHPHILDVYDFSGPDAEPSYLVTEFIPGQSLRAFADAHPFDPPELAAACLLPIAEALEHAHAAGVVHRDLKPENVMVREDGLIKLTDFGIAALLDPDEKFTVTGSILGSPAHLAPETIEGKSADPRSDLFSFGTILYGLACGELPFRAQSPAALLRQILEGKVKDPRLVRRSVSDGLAKIIAHCLERDPAKRYQDAGALKKDLLELLADAGLSDPAAEVHAFVTSVPPEAHAATVRARLVARSLDKGEEALRARRTSAALAEFGRVLALEPGNALAQGRVDRIRRRARLLKLARRAGLAAAVCVVLGVAGTQTARAVQGWRAQTAAEERLAAEKLLESQRLQEQAERDRAEEARKAALPPAEQPGAERTAVETRSPSTRETSGGALHRPTRPGRSPRTDPGAPAGRPPLLLASSERVKVLLKPQLAAQVTLDGQDLGQKLDFHVELTVGPHAVVVQHPCCFDHTYMLEVTPKSEHMVLDLGAPKPAHLQIRGASPGDKVLLDAAPLGAVQDLPQIEVNTNGQPTREASLTVGEGALARSGRVTIQAGRINTFDYFKLAGQDGQR